MNEATTRINASKQLPGGVGLWIFIVSDLLLFGLFFSLFAHDLAISPQAFRNGQASLNNTIGLINTLLLLTGSWAVAMATRVTDMRGKSARYLLVAALSGILFLLLKSIEYAHVIAAGADLASDYFFTWYFVLTGYHALHVIVAIMLLLVVATRFLKSSDASVELIESAGCYWHLVDLLWVGIFSIIYLV